MADLNPLIRVRRHTVEQKQKVLSDLYRKAEDLTQERDALLNGLESEREHLLEMETRMLSYFGPYSDAVHERVAEIARQIKTLEGRIVVAQDDMARAFADLKKIEITQERREAEDKKAQDKKDSALLDDIALDGHRRKVAEEEG